MISPSEFLKKAFPWGSRAVSLYNLRPYDWQLAAANDLTSQLEKGGNYLRVQKAIGTGHGVGATAFNVMMGLWAIVQMKNCSAVIVAPTSNVASKVVGPELHRWAKIVFSVDISEESSANIICAHKRNASSLRLVSQLSDPKEWEMGKTGDEPVFIAFDSAATISKREWKDVLHKTEDRQGPVIWCATGAPHVKESEFSKKLIDPAWCPAFAASSPENGCREDYAENMAKHWGAESDIFRARVLGRPPTIKA